MNKQHPDTFEIPSLEFRSGLRVNEFAKVKLMLPPEEAAVEKIDGEKFWIAITHRHVDGDLLIYQALVKNDLIFHDLSCNDVIYVEPRHILTI